MLFACFGSWLRPIKDLRANANVEHLASDGLSIPLRNAFTKQTRDPDPRTDRRSDVLETSVTLVMPQALVRRMTPLGCLR